MFKIVRSVIDWCGVELSLENGKVARQALGSAVARYCDTVVLATVTHRPAKERVDFFPLGVQFFSKAYAIGKIPGGFIKTEGKPSDRETLTARLIDRSIRPLFASGICDEVSVVCDLLAYDRAYAPEIPALVAVSAALGLSGLPFNGPVVGARVGYLDGKVVVNPAFHAAGGGMDLFVSSANGALVMVESRAPAVSEEVMLDAMFAGVECGVPVSGFINDFVDACASCGTPDLVAGQGADQDFRAMASEVRSVYGSEYFSVYSDTCKKTRSKSLLSIREKLISEFVAAKSCDEMTVMYAAKLCERSIVREMMLNSGLRLDGRSSDSIRQVELEVGLLPGVHGSALFTRGDTQALVVVALGTSQDEQVIDDFEGERREHFMLRYDFRPYSVGECSTLRHPSRRDIGHGRLAWKAVSSVLPSKANFPYAIRAVSEITESDGSSSMATVCGCSMALMDAGVNISSPVAGVAMGLIKDSAANLVLSDITGDEDNLGDMDFKVAGTTEGVTALQMDVKVPGIDVEIMGQALLQARCGRLEILDKMSSVITSPRSQVRENVVKVSSFQIDKTKIRSVIGVGGRCIKDICEKCDVKIDIDQEGLVTVYGVDSAAIGVARDLIFEIVADPKVGDVYDGVVTKITNFGLFVDFFGGRRGMVHISEIVEGRRLSEAEVSKMFAVNDKVKVVVLGFERGGKIRLSIKRVSSSHQNASSSVSGDGGSSTAESMDLAFSGIHCDVEVRDDLDAGRAYENGVGLGSDRGPSCEGDVYAASSSEAGACSFVTEASASSSGGDSSSGSGAVDFSENDDEGGGFAATSSGSSASRKRRAFASEGVAGSDPVSSRGRFVKGRRAPVGQHSHHSARGGASGLIKCDVDDQADADHAGSSSDDGNFMPRAAGESSSSELPASGSVGSPAGHALSNAASSTKKSSRFF